MNHLELEFLKKFITEQGKILPRSITGLSIKEQKLISSAIKQARILGLLHFSLNESAQSSFISSSYLTPSE